jgi:hypothetical protein
MMTAAMPSHQRETIWRDSRTTDIAAGSDGGAMSK